jgi:hypothetical protein
MKIWVITLEDHIGGNAAYTASTKRQATKIAKHLMTDVLGSDAKECHTFQDLDAACRESGDYINVYETHLDAGP